VQQHAGSHDYDVHPAAHVRSCPQRMEYTPRHLAIIRADIATKSSAATPWYYVSCYYYRPLPRCPSRTSCTPQTDGRRINLTMKRPPDFQGVHQLVQNTGGLRVGSHEQHMLRHNPRGSSVSRHGGNAGQRRRSRRTRSGTPAGKILARPRLEGT
jgi:hypothetical protein